MNKDPESWDRVDPVSLSKNPSHAINVIKMAVQDIQELAKVHDAALKLYMAYDGIKAIRDSGSIPIWENLRNALGISTGAEYCHEMARTELDEVRR